MMRFPLISLSALALLMHPGSMDVPLAGPLGRDISERRSTHIFESVAIVDEYDEEGRYTENEYAIKRGLSVPDVQTRFAATGIITCGKYRGSAQLTGNNDTITTSAHMFTGARDCDPGTPPESCTFTTKKGNDTQTRRISKVVGNGFKCPGKQKTGNDWAVLKLQRPIERVEPYLLPSLSDFYIKTGDKIVSVAGMSIDFHRRHPTTGSKSFPKSIEDCQVGTVYYPLGKFSTFDTTCDFSGGASGGSILRASERGTVLLGINKGNNETLKERENARDNGIVRREKYSAGEYASYHVPVDGEFLKAIERAISGGAK
ncbi:MAG: hypothetical protein CL533_18395 [Afipia sp.]|jgi:hypothetical protein|uniref:Trypsin-like peptidase domain-containing protein n=1 Tax=Afipia massiliensis TaxID=211460 RepID=A0A840N3H9_9BRAD|nr:hypothetical protein [Afipia massiliensis]MAH71190.1 hypothetical protein [Afipia sp.]MBB5053660.1 hypothetical protein [Afipia massiliensis]OUX59714.1 MAG: hypothetical protein CBB64_18350 [Afipia sp. TMED4]HCX16617.1 hypothetical protein [Afipia sp.]|tara:strand:- start:29 stop:976 length:948 start_codon:yes stop_codon:yes gene_type:complete